MLTKFILRAPFKYRFLRKRLVYPLIRRTAALVSFFVLGIMLSKYIKQLAGY